MPDQASLYLDCNATTTPDPAVIELVAKLMRDNWANPGSRHALGRKARRVLEDSRESIAAILGADPDEVLFTSGGTESNNVALNGFIRPAPGIILSGPGEHPSIAEPIKALQLQGYSSRELTVDSNGLLSEDLQQLPWAEIRIATLLLAHNETGVIQDPLPLAELCIEHQVPLHLDAVQAVGKIDVDFHATQATSLSFASHKFHGPRGIGGLLLRKGSRLVPLMRGGHQEQERRPGTESVPLIAGMAHALELWHRDREQRTTHIRNLRDQFEAKLQQALDNVTIIGKSATRLPNTSTIAFAGLDGEALLVALDLAGIACSQGSTCASGSSEPAPILIAMGVPTDQQRSAIRFSLGHQLTSEEIQQATERIIDVVRQQRERAA